LIHFYKRFIFWEWTSEDRELGIDCQKSIIIVFWRLKLKILQFGDILGDTS